MLLRNQVRWHFVTQKKCLKLAGKCDEALLNTNKEYFVVSYAYLQDTTQKIIDWS